MSFLLTNTTRSSYRIPFEAIKDEVLGSKYQLSLALIGEKRARAINKQSRQKEYAPNVLSFPLTKNSGEIYIAPAVAKKEAKSFDHSEREHLVFLYIHGLLHLQGYDHGAKMESLEQKFLKKYR